MNKKTKSLLRYFFANLMSESKSEEDILLLSKEEVESILRLINEKYKAIFGIVGCKGVGKTTTIQGLFGFKQGRNETEKLKKYTKDLGKGIGKITFYDFPGVGDWEEKQLFVENQYKKYLPDCDVVLWVIDAQSEVRSLDEYYIKNLPSKIKEKLVIGLNKVNMVRPHYTWEDELKIPSSRQRKTIEDLKNTLSLKLKIDKDRIVEYSALNENGYDARYNLEGIARKLVEVSSRHKFLIGNAFLADITQTINR